MHQYYKYTGENTQQKGYRAYREVMLFQMINHFDHDVLPDSEKGLYGTAREEREALVNAGHMTLEQKRRLRNEIFRIGNDIIRRHNEGLQDENGEVPAGADVWDVYTTNAYIQAFFETNFGKNYVSNRDAWVNGTDAAYQQYEQEIRHWTKDADLVTEARHTVISPYDPWFSSADFFTDETDELGYVIGSIAKNPDGTYVVGAKSKMTMLEPRLIHQDKDSNGAPVYSIKAVQLGRGHSIQPYDQLEMIKRSEPVHELEGELTKSGFFAISHYIRTKEDKEAVKKAMMEQMRKIGPDGQPLGPVSEEERQFMGDVCRYLSSTGLEFGVKVGNDGHLVAEVKNPKADIRILSRGDEQHQGRIYSRGVVTRLALGDGKSDSGLDKTITPQDRLNMIRWYFGETVAVSDERPGNQRYNHNVGEVYYPLKMRKYGVDVDQNPVSIPGRRGDSSSIDFAVKRIPGSNFYSTITIQRSASSVANEEDMPETALNNALKLNDSVFGNEATANPLINSDERIPAEKLLPGDRMEIPDENGNMVLARNIQHDTDRSYYRHLIAREHLAAWVDSAKETHAKMTDLDGMIAHFENVYAVNSEIDYDYSEDKDIAEVQQLYWQILTGSYDVGADTTEDRIAYIRQAYSAFSEDLFGSVPELHRDGLPQPPECDGFNPGAVSRYVSTPDSYDVQKNQSFIRHMLKRLEDDYDESFIKGDDYVANSTKNAMIAFDKEHVRSQFVLSNLLDHGKVSPAKVDEVLRDMKGFPFTRDMMIHTAETLVASGCHPDSVAVRVDERGVMEYTGYVPTVKAMTEPKKSGTDQNGRSRYTAVRKYYGYHDTVSKIREQQARDGVPESEQVLFATFDENRILPESLDKEHPMAASAGKLHRIHGTIGQVFEPDRYGAILQDTVVPDNRVLIPGYDAYLMENDPENPKPMAERLRLIGLEQQMRRAITSEVRNAVYTMDAEYDFEPHGASLNAVYRRTYDTVLDLPYYERMMPKTADRSKMTDEEKFFLRVVKTMQGRCRFPNEYGANSTTMAQSYLEHPHEKVSQEFDYYYSDLCDNQNLRVLGRYFDNIFDRDMTATAKNQGIVRYLVDKASVNPDGTVEPAKRGRGIGEPHCALMSDPAFNTMYFNSWDRRQMATTQSLTALGTPRHVGVAMINIEGYNFDDAMPVSKAFAEAHPIMGADGKLRPLMVQDKLSDFSGNKGVISAVVDPELHSDNIREKMTVVPGSESSTSVEYEFMGNQYKVRLDARSKRSQEDQAVTAIQRQLGVEGKDKLMEFFRDNPHVEIAMAPYSGMSRTNGGIARELLEDHGDVIVNGKTVKGGMGYTNIIIVDMPADVKTHWYDEQAVADGKGRKASGQLAWALQSKQCRAIMHEFFGNNQSAIDDLREYAIAVGLDFNADIQPVVGYHPQVERGERRALIKLPDMVTPNPEFEQTFGRGDNKQSGFYGYLDQSRFRSRESRDRISKKIRLLKSFGEAAEKEMMANLNEHGGFMELPFQLNFKTEEYAKLPKGVIPDGTFLMQPTGQTYMAADGEHPTYGMPVLPPGLRSGQEFQDGTSMVHAFTQNYVSIYKKALTYIAVQNQIAETADEAEKQLLASAMESLQAEAQKEFDKVTSKIAETRFNTKYNVIRESVMASRIPNSATAVWSPDPRLELDEVSMSSEHATQLGLMKDGVLDKDVRVLLWRDPILHDDNVRYMRVRIDETIHGVAINPLVDKSFDGDFDGDSVAIVPLTTKEARAEAYTKFALESNMLQKGVLDKNGRHPLYIQTGLDAATQMHANPALKEKLEELTVKVNDLEKKAALYFENPAANENLIQATTWVSKKGPDGKAVRSGAKEEKVVTGKPAINALRRQYKNELNDWAKAVLTGTGGAHIIVESEKTLIESVQKIVDSGAKGNASKMRDYMDNVGIDYEVDENGRAIAESARTICGKNGKPMSRDGAAGLQREKDMAIQETAAYKADNTALGGTTAQNGVSAFRDYDLTAALELTYPITQAILQSKHDPKDAKIKDEIVRLWGKDVWDGYKLTGDFTSDDPEVIQKSPHRKVEQFVLDQDGNRIPKRERVIQKDDNGDPVVKDGRPVYTWEDKRDRDGNLVYETAYQKCTRQEWITQMTGMMRALKVDVNPEYIDRLATVMTRRQDTPLVSAETGFPITLFDKETKSSYAVMGGKGTIAGLTDFAEENGSLLDRVAYTGRLSALVSEALKSDPGYVDTMNRLGRSHELQKGGFSSMMANTTAAAIQIQAQEEAIRQAKEAKDKAAEAAAKEEIRRLKESVSMSGTFACRQFVNEAKGDAYRSQTGDTENKFVKTRNGKETVASVAPKPVGSKACRVSDAEYEAGCAVMGERQEAYVMRMDNVREWQASSAGMTTGAEKVVSISMGINEQAQQMVSGNPNPFSSMFDRNNVDGMLHLDDTGRDDGGTGPNGPN